MSAKKPRTWAYAFEERFRPLVEAGEKRQTIRKIRKDGALPVPGDRVHCYDVLRQKGARRIADGTVVSVDLVSRGADMFRRGGVVPPVADLEAFAKADGFSSAAEMNAWFTRRYGDEPWVGYCVRWEPDGREG